MMLSGRKPAAPHPRADLLIGLLLPFITAVVLAVGCAPTLQQTPISRLDSEREAEKQKDMAFATFVKRIDRLDHVALRLSRSSADLCPSQRPAIGIFMHNAGSYGKEWQASAVRYFHLGDALTLRSVEPDFPAALAGLLPGDTLLVVNGVPLQGKTVAKAGEVLSKALASKDSVRIEFTRDGTPREVALIPQVICNYPALVSMEDMVNAYADGEKVVIMSGMMRFAESDDQLALVVAHEMAHNALGHINKKVGNSLLGAIFDVAVLAGTGVNTGGAFSDAAGQMFSQEFESEADYEGLYMVARAGIDIIHAPDFWRQMAAEHPGSIKKNFSASHPSTPERFLSLENAVKEIEKKRQGGEPLVPEKKK